MKIALYDPFPVCGGMMTWTRHMRAGLIALGHECDTVSFTRSGRPLKKWGNPNAGTQWYERPLDKVFAYKNCREELRRYDRVILVEPLMELHEKEAERNGWRLPYYVWVLEEAGVPFTTVLHSFSYSTKATPWAVPILELPSFIGVGLSHAEPERCVRGNTRVLELAEWVRAPHPYVSVYPLDGPVPPNHLMAGTTGRFAHINGFHLGAMAQALGTLPQGTLFQMYGGCPITNKPAATTVMFEMMRDGGYGYTPHREDDNPFRPNPWVLTKEDGSVAYGGAYSGGGAGQAAATSQMRVHVSPMAEDKSTGVTNYVQLEAMDAGCLPVSTDTHWRPSFRGWIIEALPTTPSLSLVIKSEKPKTWVRKLGKAMELALTCPDDRRQELIRHNREVLRTEHDPATVAKTMVEVLG